MTIGQYLLYSLLGILVVFFALALLMLIVKIVALIPDEKKQSDDVQLSSDAAANASVVPATPAPGSAGELKLYDTDPRDAAMIMAIVADEMGVPLNELRFISIKEVSR